MLTTFFTSGPVVDWNTAKQSDTKRYGRFFHHMLEQGVYLAPSQFEAAFLSTAHSTQDIEKTIRAAHPRSRNCNFRSYLTGYTFIFLDTPLYFSHLARTRLRFTDMLHCCRQIKTVVQRGRNERKAEAYF